MSRLLVTQYHTELEKIIQYGGSRKETSIRVAFQNLLNEYCKARDFLLIPELDYKTKSGKIVYPDGTVKDALRLDWGYWESKDEYDNLDDEIEKKLGLGYPDSNILFEDSQTAVLIQGGEETSRVSMKDAEALDGTITAFINYTRPEVRDFREAIANFQSDLPTILNTLRDLLESQGEINREFQQARDKFWQICKQSINPEVTLLDVREMMIQHILTEDIFINIFNESQFHRENNIARELQNAISTFFKGSTRRNTLSTIERYYAVITRNAANIYNHHEKQKFLKAVYENFYKAYNPKAADRLGIVYTPNEIVRFMIESVDYLVHQHFGKLLADKDVDIFDPATGTGTFVTELIEYLPKDKLKYKYKDEIHCNEVAILPYYIANLNIEFTYQQKMGEYEEFDNICFVDTLEHTSFEGKQGDLFALTVENTERIKRQNDRTISVIIGNPPYNANQANENDNNKNRKYPAIDNLIKGSYIKYSTAQKTKLYDMYSRFFRWATDRLHDNGVLAFVTNYSFISARTFDGFRKVVADDFSQIYIIDLGGDVRKNPKLSGTKHNVFGIQTGVAISFMVKKRGNGKTPCQIFYYRRPELETAEDKLKFLSGTKFEQIGFEHIVPDKDNNWVNLTDNDFDSFLPLVDKETKLAKTTPDDRAIFKLYSMGVVTARDEWVYGFSRNSVIDKMTYFFEEYNLERRKILEKEVFDEDLSQNIKWTRELKKQLRTGTEIDLDKNLLINSVYRPYTNKYLYYNRYVNEMQYQLPQIFPNNADNKVITLSVGKRSNFALLCTTYIFNLDIYIPNATQGIPLYCYDKEGNRIDNITDWGLTQFQTHYHNKNITKENIFHYTYAVLHNPKYRQKYELNLKREFPRLPFYENLPQWVNWGKKLMDLHINYETVTPYPLKRIDLPLSGEKDSIPKAKLKTDKIKGTIILDDITTLEGIPKIAWEYRLGNRCALEWILDQYKEKKPKDPTIAARFNTYRFADYKEKVIDLLQRVCRVSVETMEIIQEIENG
ncbi:MAG TPA: DNA methyltransferase [Cyanobacteria bacterium UBA11149]|nr:DNA methyltransferase [Cyanobacteria bacterium UBA11367]HBE58391.1 DNA methyltransferase [Cyanobacteria bacterium UBA11366]HBK63617.1 DNA methyltransferase [Cyanobacteria bacterium UBA11166]HBR73113.1 DNA methyltransferase [Cyanobacteria bacterium UBA11159]HBS68023.1 DNA methyltransferase [Cyanobacteria bacterium UBA11153]HBW88434.1 DNA methyltransferase [Cyanobacteria bacterium UBA11149]HCA93457.1 DNA methyltransferase [Cyanobacteria bacterium UBA9226]